MAEKISTIIIKVDLECDLCYKKIRKTLCKLQERENIQTIAYDEKNNKVTISGPFDPKKLSKKLCCKACKVIKDMEIVETKEKEKEKPKEKEKEKPKDAKPAEPAKPKEKEKEKPKDSKPASPPKPDKEKPKDAKQAEPAKPKEKEKEKEKEKPKAQAEAAKPKEKEKEKPKTNRDDKAKPEKEKLKPEPRPDLPKADPGWPYPVQAPVYYPGWPDAPACGCGPWYEAYYGGVRCLSCGRTYGWVAGGQPGDAYKPCYFFSEEDSSSTCNIM